MEIYISKKYLAFLFILWIAPTVNAIWGGPIWVTISFMAAFAIYAGHEWVHVWVCKINNLDVDSIILGTGSETRNYFIVDTEDPDRNRKESDVYLAGVVWDSIWFTVAILSCMFYALSQWDNTPITVGFCLILVLIFNLAMPGSDWHEFMKRTAKRT